MSLAKLINDNFKKLNENDLHILHYVQSNEKKCAEMSISDLAAHCNVSPASVLRTAKKLNFSGYSELKYFLRQSNERKSEKPLDAENELLNDIEQTIKVFRQNNIAQEVFDLMDTSKNLYAYGTGLGQNLMLQEFSRCLLNLSKNLVILPAFTELEIAARNFGKDDLLFVVSLSGNMNFLKEIILNLGVLKIPVVSITHFNNNDLASFTKYNFYYQSSSISPYDNLNRSSYLTLHLLLHLIYEDYAKRRL